MTCIHEQAVQLVKQGALPASKDKHGQTPLHYAASHGHHEVGVDRYARQLYEPLTPRATAPSRDAQDDRFPELRDTCASNELHT